MAIRFTRRDAAYIRANLARQCGGAKNAGANDIIVVDTHGAGGDRNFNSLIRESLEEGCRYLSQNNWLDFESVLRESCDAAIIIGMHAMAGTPDGVLAHTVSYNTWMECRINNEQVGETAILAALCSHYDCPVVMVSGDDATCREAMRFIDRPPVTAAVKKGIGRFSAIHLHPNEAHRLIEHSTTEALQNIDNFGVYRPAEPCTVEIQFTSPDNAEWFLKQEKIDPAGSCGIATTGQTWREAWSNFGW